MIPGRAHTLPGQTKPIVKKFDPCAVGLLNNWCETRDWKIVIHSSWIKFAGGQETYNHCVTEGLDPKYFHEDAWCKEDINWRYTRVAEWLHRHPEITHFMILDDEPYRGDLNGINHPINLRDRLVLVDFQDGINSYILNQMNGRDFRRTVSS
jgi:hypothetical protein